MKENIDNNELGKLCVDGTNYSTRLSKSYRKRKQYVPDVPGAVISFIPGTIIDVLVKEGSEVKSGDDLIILEAMKMFNRVKCPLTGVVKSVHVTPGMRVTRGTLLLEIE
jgi:biotin carboxyl carrier protein